jgi:hypothetical protein
MLEVGDSADVRSVVGEERGAAGPRSYTRVKTAAVRYQW